MIEKDNVVGIVVAYNIEKESLIENVNTYKDYIDRVFIIDNSDKDMQLEELARDKKIKYISMGGNQGIAKALNRGIELALNESYDYALTMDQDSKFSGNLIEEYHKNEAQDIIIYSPSYLIERKRQKIP